MVATSLAQTPHRRRWRWRRIAGRVAAQVVVTLLALVWLVPVAMMLTVALMPSSSRDAILGGLIVKQPTLDNFGKVWSENPLPRYFLNSLIITVPSVLLVLVVASLAAFAFARLKFWGSGV